MLPYERARLAESQMLNDESLTDSLDDWQAQKLLNWGVIRARRLAMQTVTMADAEADSYFEIALPILQRVIRKTNRIAGMLPEGSPDSILIDLQAITDSAIQLPGLLAAPAGDLPALAAHLAALSPSEAVNELISLLKLEK